MRFTEEVCWVGTSIIRKDGRDFGHSCRLRSRGLRLKMSDGAVLAINVVYLLG